MRLIELLVVCIAAASAVGVEAAPPMEFKGIRIGQSTLADVQARFPGALMTNTNASVLWLSYQDPRCDRPPSPERTRCNMAKYEDLRIAEFTQGDYFFDAVDGKVEALQATFDRKVFAVVRDAMLIKYGKPTQRGVATMQNQFGASFQGESIVWLRPDGSINLVEITDKLNESMLKMQSKIYLANKAREQQRKAEEAARKL